ncbi:MAG: amidohydrolase family protein [Rhodospirillales bacterium]
MDSAPTPPDSVPVQEIDDRTDTRIVLGRGAREARRKGYADYFIVDVDSHHTETSSWVEIIDLIEDPVVRENAFAYQKIWGRPAYLYASSGGVNHQDVAGRITHGAIMRETVDEHGVQRDVVLARRALESMGIDCTILFPTALLALGEHPQVDMQVLLGRAYTRWMTDRLLPQDPRIKALAFLPFNDPKAAVQVVRDFADKPGVVGFMVTSQTKKPVHHPDLMPVYAELEARGKPLAFHAGLMWHGEYMSQFNRFLGMHALSFVLCNMVHMTNWVLNGLPERFPNLKVVWIESGLAWLPFMMQRLDNEYMMRTSEAPLLKKKPSEYIADMYFCSQPMEKGNLEALELTMKMIRAESQLMYSSDWPHWDFDMPSVIYDLPFLSEPAKRNILGENARKVFGL